MSRPVPVLMYHHVNPHRGDMVTVTPETFEAQMRHLHEHGYRTLSLDELFSYIQGGMRLKEKAAAVTFDDAWLDNYIYAFPVLKKYGIRAAVFAVTDWIEGASQKAAPLPSSVPDHRTSKFLVGNAEHGAVALNWELVREMAESGLVDFYSHTKSHARCDQLSEDKLVTELRDSRAVLEEKLGRPCPYLCWPYGRHNHASLQIARITGYKAIFTTRTGVARSGSNPFSVSRIVVKDDLSWFRKRMFIYTSGLLSAAYLKLKKR